MLAPAKLLALLNEIIFVLLGLLLVQVALTGRLFWNRRAPAWIGLGAFLIYWGLRALWRAGFTQRPAPHTLRAAAAVRGASLAMLGVLMLGVAWMPFAWVAPLLIAAGVVMALRGAVNAALLVHAK